MHALINRPVYMEQLISFREKQIIKVVTGIRRCGKSTLFDLYCEYLRKDGVGDDQIIRINLEDPDYFDIQDYMQKRLFWGTDGIRMAFGYGACPDHALKVPVLDMLKADKTIDISLTESNMINPGESICGLIFANTPLKYFNV